MNAPDWKKIIATVAPGLATVLGGPLAGAAVGALSQAVLGKPDGSEAELAAAIGPAHPDILARIREADAKLQADLANAGVRVEEIAAGDRASARAREMTVRDRITPTLALLYTVAYFAALWAVWHYGIPEDAKEVLITLLGVLTGAQATIMTYYFGSSSGSAAKTAILNKVVGS